MNPALGTASSDATYPLGKTGLSFRIGTGKTTYPYLRHSIDLLPGDYHTEIDTFTLEIIKTEELLSEIPVPAGFLGNFQTTDLVFIKFNLINLINLNTASCKSPNVSVQMGDDYRIMDFDNAGDAPQTVKFNIDLNECQTGIKKVNYAIKANTHVIDAGTGIVALDSSSTAKGIGLKLMDETGQPIALAPYSFNGFNTSATSFTIPLAAACYRLPNANVEAGTANTSVTFIMSYL